MTSPPTSLASKLFGLAAAALAVPSIAVYRASATALSGWTQTLTDQPRSERLAISAALFLVFTFQHSFFARRWVKAWMTRLVGIHERSVYLVGAVLTYCAFMVYHYNVFAVGLPVLYDVPPPWRYLNRALQAVFYLYLVVGATFCIDFFWFFGLSQTFGVDLNSYFGFRDTSIRDETGKRMTIRGVYRYIRHPMYVGGALVIALEPTVTAATVVHLGFFLAYVAVSVPYFEEPTMISEFGAEYTEYKAAVHSFCPCASRAPETRGRGLL